MTTYVHSSNLAATFSFFLSGSHHKKKEIVSFIKPRTDAVLITPPEVHDLHQVSLAQMGKQQPSYKIIFESSITRPGVQDNTNFLAGVKNGKDNCTVKTMRQTAVAVSNMCFSFASHTAS